MNIGIMYRDDVRIHSPQSPYSASKTITVGIGGGFQVFNVNPKNFIVLIMGTFTGTSNFGKPYTPHVIPTKIPI